MRKDLNQAETSTKKKKSARKHSSRPASRSHRNAGRAGHNPGPNWHALFFLCLAAVAIVLTVRFLVWNRGRTENEDAGADGSFDTEPLDFVLPGAVTDQGPLTVLALGNDPFSDDRSGDGLAELLADRLEATVYNGAFPGSTVATKNLEYQNSYPMDGLSLYWVAAALCGQKFDLMELVAQDTGDSAAQEAAKTLTALDLEQVDLLLILYDLQDYLDGRILYDEANLSNINSYYGALNASIQLFQETFPQLQIVFLGPPYGTSTQPDGAAVDADRDDLGNGALPDYINRALEACQSNGVSFIDLYYGAITPDGARYLTDGFHLNQEGRRRVADRVTFVLTGK